MTGASRRILASVARRWRLVLTLAAIAVLTMFLDPAALMHGALAVSRDPLPLLAALVAYTLGFGLRAVAWGPLLPSPVPWRLRLRALLAMLAANHTFPGPVGEVVRARLVTSARLPFARALASVAAARVVDVFAVGFLLGLGALLSGDAPNWARWGAPVAVTLPALVVWFGVTRPGRVARRYGVRLDAVQFARAAAWALPSWALEAGVVLVVAGSAGWSLSPPAAVLVTCMSLLAQVFAVLPGGIGTYEAGMTTGLVALGVPVSDALAVAVVTHGVKFVYALVVGGVVLVPTSARAARAARAARRALA
ncbi:MAG: flippase-like domain-containing protein [Actinomycetota bacterium]|nr:flippase-like domain-containing protein [Actinomycetota bacterium]